MTKRTAKFDDKVVIGMKRDKIIVFIFIKKASWLGFMLRLRPR